MRLELARIEMAPRPLLGVIKGGQVRAAFWARPPRRIMLQPEVDAFVFGLQLDVRDVPRRGDSQNRLEEFRVLQRRSFPALVVSAGHVDFNSALEQAAYFQERPAQAAPRISWIRCDALRLSRDRLADGPLI
jgi:hypothetical protein